MLINVFVLFFFIGSVCCFSQELEKESVILEERQEEFSVIETPNFDVYYEEGVSLRRIYSKLKRRVFFLGRKLEPKELSGYEEKVAYRMRVLFSRVKEVLSMYPCGFDFNIKIFKNRRTLMDKYNELAKRKERVRAFYFHDHKTVYTCEPDISDSVLAHEMAHIIIHYYFIVMPPIKIREMIAIYADSHLEG
jgi:hypothetical protein